MDGGWSDRIGLDNNVYVVGVISSSKNAGEIRDFRNVNAEISDSFEPGTSRTLSENYTPKPISLADC